MIEVEEKNMYVGGIYRIADEKNKLKKNNTDNPDDKIVV